MGELVPQKHRHSPSIQDFIRVAHEMSEIRPGDPMPMSKAQRCHTARLDGTPINIERTVSGIRFRGEPALLVLARDITEEIEVERALHESEDRLRDAQSMARVGHYAFDIPGDQWTSSEALDKVLGITREFTRDFAGWAALLHPDDRDEMVAYFTNEIVTGLHGFDKDYRIVRPSDGETRWVHGIGQLTFGDDGKPVEMFGTIQDITERKLAEEIEHRYSERLSAMASELTVTEDRERRRLAEELHDRVSQQLAMAKLHLGSATTDPSMPDAVEIARAAALIEEAIGETRAITTQLAPPILYELGVGPALRWQCEDVACTMGLDVRFLGHADESGVSDEAKVVVFRAVRELLVNVVKHAGTSQAWVNVDSLPGWLEVSVVDEGRGFDPASPSAASGDSGFGLFSIRERLPHLGGEFEFESVPGEGTRVTLRVPRQEP
jgi:PAS domain S-box-containing protein